jgi:hypothetical protein
VGGPARSRAPPQAMLGDARAKSAHSRATLDPQNLFAVWTTPSSSLIFTRSNGPGIPLLAIQPEDS